MARADLVQREPGGPPRGSRRRGVGPGEAKGTGGLGCLLVLLFTLEYGHELDVVELALLQGGLFPRLLDLHKGTRRYGVMLLSRSEHRRLPMHSSKAEGMTSKPLLGVCVAVSQNTAVQLSRVSLWC